MLFNPLEIILNQNKLTRPNYVYWKSNLDIVLVIEGYKYNSNDEHLDLLAVNAPIQDIERFKKWVKADSMTHCYILALMSSIL